MSGVVNMKDHQYRDGLDVFEAAFRTVFPDEQLVSVECETVEERGQVFAITSSVKTRRYLRAPGQSVEDVLRTVPAFPEPKDEK